jgi:hypothetical protein
MLGHRMPGSALDPASLGSRSAKVHRYGSSASRIRQYSIEATAEPKLVAVL